VVESSDLGSNDVLWLFLHIPKTAGTSFRRALARELRPDHNISIDRVRDSKKRDDAFREAIDEFLERDNIMRFMFASGHIKMEEAERIRQAIARPVKFITILRDPVERVISEFRYQSTPAHPQNSDFVKLFPTIETFITHPRSQNKMRRHLALRGEKLESTIRRLENDFSLVGVVESYSFFVKLCSQLVGRPLDWDVRERVTEATAHNDIEVNEDLRKTIRALNSEDDRLWNHFSDRIHTARAS
jgi:hypothetical protein